jgi:hypothetical protein
MSNTPSPIEDRYSAGSGIRIPVVEQFTFECFYSLEKGDSLYHNYSLTAGLYMADPTRLGGNCNPDGRAGIPILFTGFGGRVPDPVPDRHRYWFSLGLLIPVSGNLTLGSNWIYYEEKESLVVDDYSGVINFYLKSYPEGGEYSTPDGVEGWPSFSLQGGGSGEGYFGQLKIAVPLKKELSVTVLFRGEKTKSPDVKTAILQAGFSFYPQKY